MALSGAAGNFLGKASENPMQPTPLCEIRQQVEGCQLCPLAATRTHTVFGVGNPESPLMLIGEGPGEQEDLTGEPFVGRSGQLLDLLLEAVDLSRQRNVYITNIVKCRPPKNRDPRPEEAEACRGFLQAQLQVINPQVIVCLGRVAAQILIDPGFKVTRQHGQWIEGRDGRVYLGTFHPSALLRNPAQKPAAFEDMLKLRRYLEQHFPDFYPPIRP